MSDPKIGMIRAGEPLVLQQHGNDGWTVESGPRHPGERTSIVGAYTTTDEMIAALAAHLPRSLPE